MSDGIAEKLQALYIIYQEGLPAKISSLEDHWQDLNANWDANILHDFHRHVHSLSGSSAVYGYDDLSMVSRELEAYLKDLEENKSLRTDEVVTTITQLVETLKVKSNLAPQRATLAFPKAQTAQLETASIISKEVYVVDNDNKFIQELNKNLTHGRYSIKIFKDLSDLRQKAIEGVEVVAIIVDIEHMDNADVLKLLQIRKTQQFTMSLICISNTHDLLTRLKAVRSGGSAFLQKPIEMFQLTNLLDKAYDSTVNEAYRILIIDDTLSLAEYYSLILQHAGMITKVVTNPLALMEALADFQPDLLLMDVYMPECSGLELAKVLRQEPLYTGLPIIFISTEDDKFKQLSAMSLGGDDFLTKPVSPQHLVAAVRSRAQRAGTLSSVMIRDSLTQLLNHNTIVQDLELELARAEKQSQLLSFVIIDIDHFKTINDSYGHLMGDYVLRKLSQLLLLNVDKTDLVGRYGGEEFALILLGKDAITSKKLCEEIREKFSHLQFKSGNNEFYVTISAGIASFPGIREAEKMIAAADKALYKAKHFGRNQVVHTEEE